MGVQFVLGGVPSFVLLLRGLSDLCVLCKQEAEGKVWLCRAVCVSGLLSNLSPSMVAGMCLPSGWPACGPIIDLHGHT